MKAKTAARAPFLLTIRAPLVWLLALSIAPLTWAQPAIEIVAVQVSGAELAVVISSDDAFAPGETLELRYLAATGSLLESELATPAAGSDEVEVLFDGHFATVASRGWQHRLLVLGSDGTEATALDLRLGLDCDATGICKVQTWSGLSVTGAMALHPDLAAHFSPGKSVDLPKLVLSKPELQGRAIELTADLVNQFGSETGSCVCFYTFALPLYDGLSESVLESTSNGSMEEPAVWIGYFKDLIYADSQRFEAGRTTLAQVDIGFQCYSVQSLIQSQATTNSGIIWGDLALLDPCPLGCSATVDWQLQDLEFLTRLAPGGDASASSHYSLTWSVDGDLIFNSASGFSASGQGTAPLILNGQSPAPAIHNANPTPTSSVIKLVTSGEIAGWSMVDLPSAQVSLETAHSAIGEAECGPPMQVTNLMLRANGGGKATLAVVLGPNFP